MLNQFASAHPAFRVVFVQSRLLPTAIEMNQAFNQEIAQQLADFFGSRNPALEQNQRELIATVCVEVASALDILALSRSSTFQH